MDTQSFSLLEYLVPRWLDSTATPEEEAQLIALVEQHEADPRLTELLEELVSATEPVLEYRASEWQPVIDAILATPKQINDQQIDRPDTTIAPRIHRVHFVRRWRWVAAAALIAVMVLTTIRFFNRETAPDLAALPQAERLKTVILPAKEGAILRLSNGQEILLDSAGNGLLYEGFNKSADGLTVTASEVQYATITTPNGRTQNLTLSDGTRVWLNAGSSIRFPTSFKGDTREINLTGEGYFEVAKDATRKFIAITPTDRIEVLGTHFNINTYGPAVKTTLLEGSVRIGNTVLAENQQYADGKITQLDEQEMVRVMAWKNGLFSYRDQPIEELMKEIARWYDVEVIYKGKVNKLFIATIPRSATAAEVFKALEIAGGVHFVIEGKRVTVMP